MRGFAFGVVALALSLAGCTTGSPEASRSVGPSTVSSQSAAPVSRSAGEEIAEARSMLAKVQIGGRGAKTAYQRTQDFGEAWVDVDGNGCRTRDDVLARDLTVTAKRNSCVVTAGVLRDPYTGQSIDFSKAQADRVQIDHVFPLALAWQLGAPQWSRGSGWLSRTTQRSCSPSAGRPTRTRGTRDRTRGFRPTTHTAAPT